jgi:hypothetical protein
MNTRGTQEHRLGQGDIVALEQALGRGVLEADQPLLAFQIGKDSLIDGFGRHLQPGGNVLQNRVAVKGAGRLNGTRYFLIVAATADGSCRKHQLTQFLRRMATHYLEFAAVFQQLGQALVHKLAGVGTERFFQILLERAAGPAFLAAEQIQKALGHLLPGRIGHVQVTGDDPITGVTNADQFTGKHGVASAGRWSFLQPCRV